jgi:hypothetical protein
MVAPKPPDADPPDSSEQRAAKAAFGPDSLDRRRARRAFLPPTRGPISVVGARVRNASPYGMSIESPVSLPAGEVIPLRLVVGGIKEDVSARVVASTPLPTEPGERRRLFGIGLEFSKMPDALRERLIAALESAPAEPPRSSEG